MTTEKSFSAIGKTKDEKPKRNLYSFGYYETSKSLSISDWESDVDKFKDILKRIENFTDWGIGLTMRNLLINYGEDMFSDLQKAKAEKEKTEKKK